MKDTKFKKGQAPWNKGLTKNDSRVRQYAEKGALVKKGKHYSPNTEFKKEDVLGEKNYKWKGDRVGYFGLHTWVQRTLGKAIYCQNNPKHNSTKFEWANKSHQYKRDPEDWISLCKKCHGEYDSGINWGSATRRYHL